MRSKRLELLADVFFFLGLVAAVALPTLAYVDKAPPQIITLGFVSGEFVAVMARLHLFSEIALGPLKASLVSKIVELEALQQRLRSLGLLVAKFNAQQIAQSRRIVTVNSVITEEDRARFMIDMKDVLEDFGVKNSDIRDLDRIATSTLTKTAKEN